MQIGPRYIVCVFILAARTTNFTVVSHDTRRALMRTSPVQAERLSLSLSLSLSLVLAGGVKYRL